MKHQWLRTGGCVSATIVLAWGCLAATAQARGESFRCNNGLVDFGDRMGEVVAACGEPVRKSRLVNRYNAPVGYEHIYDAGYGKAQRQVIYNSDREVTRIRRLD